MSLFVGAPVVLHSGQGSNWKIECDNLTSGDWATLALMLSECLPPFGSVEGVPQGGRRLARFLGGFASAGPLLIVDDVLTTGMSMEKHRDNRDAIGAVVFARGKCPYWVTALFQMEDAIG